MTDFDKSLPAGLYGCAIWTPVGAGFGVCADADGNIYPQLAIGLPGPPSFTFGRASDPHEYLTGTSISMGGSRFAGGNKIEAGWNPSSRGYGVTIGGAPGFGAGATYGPGYFNVRDIPSYIRKLPTLLYPQGGDFQEIYPMP